MTTYDPYSIVVVPFPFVDSPKTKRRPALVLSSKKFQQETGHVVLVMITSAKHTSWYGDTKISDLKKAGLTKGSVIRQKYFTLDNRLILKNIGRLTRANAEEVKANSLSVIFFK